MAKFEFAADFNRYEVVGLGMVLARPEQYFVLRSECADGG